jgi:hypothetical protein
MDISRERAMWRHISDLRRQLDTAQQRIAALEEQRRAEFGESQTHTIAVTSTNRVRDTPVFQSRLCDSRGQDK